MSVTLEQVERLREKSGASYEECRDALERSGGDLLDALILLERMGKSGSGAHGGTYTTQPGGGVDEAARLVLQTTQPQGGKKKSKEGGGDWLRELWGALVNLLRHSTVNQFEVWRKGRLMTSIPILILVLLVIVAFWVSVSLLVLGLVLGCRYRFVGPDLGRERVNSVVDNVSATVDGVVEQVKQSFRGAGRGNPGGSGEK